MYIPLIFFFVSLAGIAVMIGRKLILQKAGMQLENKEEFLFEIPHPEKIKVATVRSAKKYGYITLVTTIKLYVKSLNFAKWSFKEIIHRIEIMYKRYILKKDIEVKEMKVSTFLKMISDYKEKISDIKDKISEEEKNK